MDLISFIIEKSQQQIEYLEWQKVKVAKVSKKVLPTTPEVNPIKRKENEEETARMIVKRIHASLHILTQ